MEFEGESSGEDEEQREILQKKAKNSKKSGLYQKKQ